MEELAWISPYEDCELGLRRSPLSSMYRPFDHLYISQSLIPIAISLEGVLIL